MKKYSYLLLFSLLLLGSTVKADELDTKLETVKTELQAQEATLTQLEVKYESSKITNQQIENINKFLNQQTQDKTNQLLK